MNEPAIDAEFEDRSAPEDRVGAALAVVDLEAAALALPSLSPAQARDAMTSYIAVCQAVLLPSDYQEFKERGKTRRFKKKSAVKKLQTFWSITVTVHDIVRDDLGDGHFGFRMTAKAEAQNGRVIEATGGCSTLEERFDVARKDRRWDEQRDGWVPFEEPEAEWRQRQKKAVARAYHDVLSTAETRATNRAVMNCIGVGGGELTAEEVTRDRAAWDKNEPDDDAPNDPPAARKSGNAAARAAVNAATGGGKPVEGPTLQELVDETYALARLLHDDDWIKEALKRFNDGRATFDKIKREPLLDFLNELYDEKLKADRDKPPVIYPANDIKIKPGTRNALMAMLGARKISEKGDRLDFATSNGILKPDGAEIASYNDLYEKQAIFLCRCAEKIPVSK